MLDIAYGHPCSTYASAAMYQHRFPGRLVRPYRGGLVLLGERRSAHVRSVDVNYFQSFRSDIGNEANFEALVKSELTFVENANNGANALGFGFLDPSVDN